MRTPKMLECTRLETGAPVTIDPGYFAIVEAGASIHGERIVVADTLNRDASISPEEDCLNAIQLAASGDLLDVVRRLLAFDWVTGEGAAELYDAAHAAHRKATEFPLLTGPYIRGLDE
jgi:hypothetical protein